MSLDRYPSLKALKADLVRLDVAETVRDATRRENEDDELLRVEAPWLNESFLMSRTQRETVSILMSAWTGGGSPDVPEESLLRRSRAGCESLAELFADHAAWGTLVVPGLRPGTYRLGGPNE